MTDPADIPICPICKARVPLLNRTGDFTGYDCETDGKFKVADTIFRVPSKLNASRKHWEAALAQAQARAKPNEWPLIGSDNLP